MNNKIEKATHIVSTPQVSGVEIFNYLDCPVRVVIRDGEPWWVAKDVCDLLGYEHTPSAIRRLEADEYSQAEFSQVAPNVRRSGPPPRPMTVVNEAGLYSLILWSHKPEAKQFKRWVTHEVLPTIRKTGGYAEPGLDLTSPEKVLEVMRASVEAHQQLLKDNAELEGKVVELTPKAGRYDAFMSTEETKSIREVARMLKPYDIRERVFIDDYLRDSWNWIDRQGTAAKVYAVEQGYMSNKIVYKPNGDTATQGRFTKKGIETAFRKLCLSVPGEAA
jgi:anti-repressor protein